MSAYFDRRSELFHRAFGDAVPYREYLATGNSGEAAAWARADATLPALPHDAQTRLDAAGRVVNVLCLSGIWCGDRVRSVPIGPSVHLGLVDRDAVPELRDELRVLGAMRVPVVVFLSENFHEIGRYGDRPLTVYREKAATELGAACPLPGSADRGALAAETAEWLDVFERGDPDGPAGAAASGAARGSAGE